MNAKPFSGVVYLHWCPISEKGYVGQTTGGLTNRWCDQVKVTRWHHHAGYNYPLSHAIRKYGAATFDHQILAVAKTKAELDNLEKIWIILLQTRENGYNLAAGGEGNPGLRHSQETRDRISRNRKGKAIGNQGAAGTIRTPEMRAQVSAKLKGKKFSAEHNEKIRIARTGVKRPDVTAWNNRRWANPEARVRASLLAKEQRRREIVEKSNG